MEEYSKLLAHIDKLRQFFITSINDTERIAEKLKTIETIVKNMTHTPFDVNTFVENHKVSLYRIYDTLVGTYKNYYFNNSTTIIPKARSINDLFFKSILKITNPKNRFARIPTLLTMSFCKGITYFKTNNGIDAWPFYHRTESCGAADKKAEDKFIEHVTNSDTTKEAKKIYVRNCYMERKIFDDIYNNTFHQQDMRHLYELQIIERIYQDYFPHESLSIRVNFKDGYYPIGLVVSSYNVEANSQITEYYTKSRYDSNTVECKRIVNGKQYIKTQTFNEETAWIAI